MATCTIRGKVKASSVPLEFSIKADEGAAAERRFSGYASTPTIDRVKEVVETGAFKQTLSEFQKNPIMLYMHNSQEPIGHFDQFELRDEGLWVQGVVGEGFHPADRVWKQIEQGHLRALSIGFREIDGKMKKIMDAEGNKHEIYHITDLELLEISVVSVPANREALFTMENGKLINIEMIPDSVELAEDAELVSECARRGLTVQPTVETVMGNLSDPPPPSAPEEEQTVEPAPIVTVTAKTYPILDAEGVEIGSFQLSDDSAGGGSAKLSFFPPPTNEGYEQLKALEERVEKLEATNKDLRTAVQVLLKTMKNELDAKERQARGNGSPKDVLATV